MISKKFWRNKLVLVTGFEGFLGSHLTKTLVACGAKVIGLDIKTFRKDTVLDSADYKKMIVYRGSVADAGLLRKIFSKYSVGVVFHLAAEAIVGCSYKNPLHAFQANIAGTWEVLEAARGKRSLRAIVVASSDKAYGSHIKLPYREDAPLIANHPYDVSKSCADLIANTYIHTYGLPIAITRCGNIYGPGDFNFSRLIPDALRCLFLNQQLKIRSDGKFVRDYVYVADIVSGYLRIAELIAQGKISGQAFNLSDESPLTVIDLLKQIEKNNYGGNKLKYQILDSARYEIKKQYLSSAKARKLIDWKPAFSLAAGLKQTIGWYREYFIKR